MERHTPHYRDVAPILLALLALPVTASAQAVKDSLATTRLRELLTSKTDLIDPFSAQVRNLAYRRGGRTDERWCGEINSKNVYGAYTGWHAFLLWRVDTVAIFRLEQVDGNTVADVANSLIVRLCRSLGPRGSRFSNLVERENYLEEVRSITEEPPVLTVDPSTEAELATAKVEGVAFPYPQYLRRIVAEVYRRWHRPMGEAPLKAEIQFMIRRDGSISNLQFIKRSGSFAFDLEAEGAIEAAGNARAFGPLPSGYPADVLPVMLFFRPPR